MNQLTALRELAENVEAGTSIFFGAGFKAFDRLGFGGDAGLAENAYGGSLDAAHSLHKAVLGDRWTWALYAAWKDGPNEAQVELLPLRFDQPTSGQAPTPARAWLIAIIKAKIAELEN